MSIIKDYLNSGDLNDLKNWMDEHLVPQYFASVTYANSTITCKDADNNILLTISSTFVVTMYASGTLSKAISDPNAAFNRITYCALSTYGCIIEYVGSYVGAIGTILISKTNNNITAVVCSAGLSKSALGTYTCIVWGDTDPLGTFACTPITTAQQTQIMPFLSSAPYGTVSYTPNAFLIPIGQYYDMGIGQLTINGNIYLCNGYWAIKDGAVSAS